MLPLIKTLIPGPKSRALMAELAQYECPAITARSLARAAHGGIDCPLVLAKAWDVFLEDVDGNRLLDFTSGFGVASVGHAHPQVISAAQQQLQMLPHAMGDALPAAQKVALARRLAAISPGDLQRTLFANAGFEAVEAALKTAMITTGKPGIIAFADAYHGLGYGALAVTSYRDTFRQPFLPQLNPHIYRLPYPQANVVNFAQLLEATIKGALHSKAPIGALIIEPILGRGGIVCADRKHLHQIRELTAQYDIALIVDEIYTGFGRTGTWFACEHAQIVPDLLCIGKSMNGGFPISAVIGTDQVMRGWEDSKGEAIHTSTFLGNPVGCAMSLACIEILANGLLARVSAIGEYFSHKLAALCHKYPAIIAIRGRGLMLGIEFAAGKGQAVLALHKSLLQAGFLALPCGIENNVLSITPPFTIKKQHINSFIAALAARLE